MEPVTPPERQLISLFLDMVAAERGGAANTLTAYTRDLGDLTGYLATRKRTISSATTPDLRGYLAALADRSFAASSVARRDCDMLIVRGKGGKERLVPLNGAAKSAMRDYRAALVEWNRDRASQSKWLFASFGEDGHLTRQHAARELKDLAVAAGLRPEQVSPHVLRRACASHLR